MPGRRSELVVCGGGAFNADLMARLGGRLAPVAVVSSADRGLPPDQVEACAFAWLARAFVAARARKHRRRSPAPPGRGSWARSIRPSAARQT